MLFGVMVVLGLTAVSLLFLILAKLEQDYSIRSLYAILAIILLPIMFLYLQNTALTTNEQYIASETRTLNETTGIILVNYTYANATNYAAYGNVFGDLYYVTFFVTILIVILLFLGFVFNIMRLFFNSVRGK